MTIFLPAFPLFLLELLIGKAILPWFGGTPAVWLTCLLFFQVLLLLGYGRAVADDRIHAAVDGRPQQPAAAAEVALGDARLRLRDSAPATASGRGG